jgi:hypothetical protein
MAGHVRLTVVERGRTDRENSGVAAWRLHAGLARVPGRRTTTTFAAIAFATAAPSVGSPSTPFEHEPPPRLMLMTFTSASTASSIAEAMSAVSVPHCGSSELSLAQLSSGVGKTR